MGAAGKRSGLPGSGRRRFIQSGCFARSFLTESGRRGIEGDPPPQVPPGYLLCPGAEPDLPGLLCVAPVEDASPVAAPELPWSTPGPCPLLS